MPASNVLMAAMPPCCFLLCLWPTACQVSFMSAFYPTAPPRPPTLPPCSFVFEDFELLDYAPHKAIKMEMAV